MKNLTFPLSEGLSYEGENNGKILRELGHASNDTLFHCQMIQNGDPPTVTCSFKNTIHMSVADGSSGYRNCYTLFSNINSSVLNRHILPVPKRKEALFHMVFDIETDEYFRPDRQIGIMVAFHSPNNIINPFFDGFVIKPENLYSVHLKVVEEKLLPSPYETQCKDYKAMWTLRGGKGPLSQETCLSECVYNVSLSQCGCVIPDILYPHNDRICTEDELDCFDYDIAKCYDACQQPCNFKDYEYDVQERKLQDSQEVTKIEDYYNKTRNSKAILLVFLKRPEIIVYSHRPQYEDIEVFSFIGGYVGMWLGVSLIAVFDFLESIARFANFWLHKRLLQRTHTPV